MHFQSFNSMKFYNIIDDLRTIFLNLKKILALPKQLITHFIKKNSIIEYCILYFPSHSQTITKLFNKGCKAFKKSN